MNRTSLGTSLDTALDAPLDAVIAGARVIDPTHGIDETLDIGIGNGRIARLGRDLARTAGAAAVHDAAGAIALPGLIDLHTHVYHKATSYGVDPDAVARRSLVTTMVDAGSAGAGNYAGLADFVIGRAATRVLAFLNISFPGIFAFDRRVMVGEAAHRALLDVPRCVEEARRHADSVVGIKVRLGGAVSGEVGLEALDRAIEAAALLALPVMCHVGRPPPGYAEIVDRLRAGDILTHCFRPAPNAPVDDAGHVLPSLRRGRQRGVLFDIGHGMGAFGFASADAAIAEGFLPDCISSDVHGLSVDGPAFDLLHTMNKLLNCGLGLSDVVRMVTVAPAQALRRPDLGHLGVGACADVALLKPVDVALRFTDAAGVQRDGVRLLKPLALWRGGRHHAPLPRPWELPREGAAA
ncbi:MAG: amidohydrolase/deacetylase family metallohydrolase [Proteobacteria bacterium]|nr:amidohydrolase/deacetylase family metallohydrolase [Pseudomonadota bacterium]